MNFLFLSHIKNELIIPSQLYSMFVISHYRDYFIFLSFISFGFLYLLRKEIKYTYKFFKTTKITDAAMEELRDKYFNVYDD